MDDDPRYNVLFLCTRNATRGILAEALLNLKGRERFKAFSAGTHPAGKVSDPVLELLNRLAIPTQSLRSKSWDEYAGPSGPRMDFVFTLCDKAVAESCPQWPGRPVTAFWNIPDPSLVDGTELVQAAAYRNVFSMLERRISLLLSLPLDSIDRLSMVHHINAFEKNGHRAATAVLSPAANEV
jgi:arsenate reductase